MKKLVILLALAFALPVAAQQQQFSGELKAYDKNGQLSADQTQLFTMDPTTIQIWPGRVPPYYLSITGVPYAATVPQPAPSIPSGPPSYVTDCPHLGFSDNFQNPNFGTQELSEWGPITGTVKWIVHKPDGFDWGGYHNHANQPQFFDTSKGYLNLDMHNWYRTLSQPGDGNWYGGFLSCMANKNGGAVNGQSTGFGASAPCYWEIAMWVPPVDPTEPPQVGGMWPSFSLYTDPAGGLTNAVEIDIPELYSIDYRVFHLSSRTWNNGVQSGWLGMDSQPGTDLSTGWHVWGVWVDTSSISYYLDGKLLFTGGTQTALGLQKLYAVIANVYGGGYPLSMNPAVLHPMRVAYIACWMH